MRANIERMRRSSVLLVTWVVLTLACPFADAQDSIPETQNAPEKPEHYARGEMLISGITSLPFADDADAGLGFGVAFGVGWNKLPLSLGFGVYAAYGGTSERRAYVPSPDGPLRVRTTREDRTVFLDLWLKLRPFRWIVSPYVEGFVGGQVLRPHYTLDFVDGAGRSELDGDEQWVKMAGYGAGLEFSVDKARHGAIALGFRRAHAGVATLSRTVETATGEEYVRVRAPLSTLILSLSFLLHIDFLAGPSKKP